MKYLAIWRCTAHDFTTLCLENEDGGGTRLIGGKCCGRLDQLVKRWVLSPEKAEEIVNEIQCAMEEEQQEERDDEIKVK